MPFSSSDLLPVARSPETCQSSMRVNSEARTKQKTYSAGVLADSDLRFAPTMTHDACSTPLANAHLPSSRKPPSAGTSVPMGATEEATNTSGPSAKISSWPLFSSQQAAMLWNAQRVPTHAVEGQPAARSVVASSTSVRVRSSPPYARGTNARKSPALRRLAMVSAGTRRSLSAASARIRTSGMRSTTACRKALTPVSV